MADRLGTDPHWRCWVAEQPDGIVGNLWLQLIEKVPNPVAEPEHHAYITNVYVVPDGRGAGVGALLLETALEWCRGSKIDAVLLWPSARSRSLYERHGFCERDDLFALRPVSTPTR
jgi:GNAT superfamily N-acetyltransferase